MTQLTRRGFLGGLLAAAAAPAIVKAESLMVINPALGGQTILGNIYGYPTLWSDLIHDDAPAIAAITAGLPIYDRSNNKLLNPLASPVLLDNRRFLLKSCVDIHNAKVDKIKNPVLFIYSSFDIDHHGKGLHIQGSSEEKEANLLFRNSYFKRVVENKTKTSDAVIHYSMDAWKPLGGFPYLDMKESVIDGGNCSMAALQIENNRYYTGKYSVPVSGHPSTRVYLS